MRQAHAVSDYLFGDCSQRAVSRFVEVQRYQTGARDAKRGRLRPY